MTSAPQYEPDRVGGRGTLVLDESVLELYFAADHPAAVETAVLELAMRVIPCGYAGLTAATIDGGLVVGSDPVRAGPTGSAGHGPLPPRPRRGGVRKPGKGRR